MIESKRITGDSAEEIIALLASSLSKEQAGHFCEHDPIYGIEIYRPGTPVFRTSLCFTCLTWVQPGRRMNISGKPGETNELFLRLQQEIEIPPELKESASEKG